MSVISRADNEGFTITMEALVESAYAAYSAFIFRSLSIHVELLPVVILSCLACLAWLYRFFNVKALVGTFNQEKSLV